MDTGRRRRLLCLRRTTRVVVVLLLGGFLALGIWAPGTPALGVVVRPRGGVRVPAPGDGALLALELVSWALRSQQPADTERVLRPRRGFARRRRLDLGGWRRIGTLGADVMVVVMMKMMIVVYRRVVASRGAAAAARVRVVDVDLLRRVDLAAVVRHVCQVEGDGQRDGLSEIRT